MHAGLRAATLTAIASANYIARRLDEYYPVLYTGENGMVAHECILDLRGITKATGVTVDDVAKRLADYGFHAPTMSFPVAGTLMVEPTESESLAEVDAFCEAMIAIRAEIDKVGSGQWPAEDNPLRGAPHTAECLLVDAWEHPYTREQAAYPLGKNFRPKVWPPVRRIDGAYGDRNLVCSCPPVEAFAVVAQIERREVQRLPDVDDVRVGYQVGPCQHSDQLPGPVVAALPVGELGQRPQRVPGNDLVPIVEPRLLQNCPGCRVHAVEVVGDRDDRPQEAVPVPALGQHLQRLARHHGVMPGLGEIRDQQPLADVEVALGGSVGDLEDLAERRITVEALRQFLLRVTQLHPVPEGHVRDLQLLADDDVVGVGQVVGRRDGPEATRVAVELVGQRTECVAGLYLILHACTLRVSRLTVNRAEGQACARDASAGTRSRLLDSDQRAS